MNLHEYQAKELFRRAGIPVLAGHLLDGKDDLAATLAKVGSAVVLKAQVHAGGRGKAGGIRVAQSTEEAENHFDEIFGMKLVTAQTGPAGRVVRKVLVEPMVMIEKELYVSVAMDRAKAMPVLLFSPEGGVEIEQLHASHPEKIFRVHFWPGETPDTQPMLSQAGITGALAAQLSDILAKLAKLFVEVDAVLVEVNPLAVLMGGDVTCLDAKVVLEDNALFRHPDLVEWRDPGEEDPRERDAHKVGLSYVGLDGSIGCMVNGAGLAMATMDIIKFFGGEPANFLDVGGSTTADRVAAALRIILRGSGIRAVLVNIFGGIVRCDLVARGVLDALGTEKPLPPLTISGGERPVLPLVVRLEGTNVEEGKALLAKSGYPIITADTFEDAGRKAVEASRQGIRR